MRARSLRIAVLGAGVAGAALALRLGRRGHEVHCFERDAASARGGAGLLLSPSGQTALQTLGLLEAAFALGARVEGLRTLGETGRVVLDLRYAQWRAGAGGLGLHRAALVALLREQAAHVARIDYDTNIAQADPVSGRVRDRDGRVDETFDLIVGADGRNSIARAAIADAAPLRAHPWSARLCLLDASDDDREPVLLQRYRDDAQLATWPVGRCDRDSTPRLHLSWREMDTRRDASFDLERWRARVIAMDATLAPLLARIDRDDRILQVGYATAPAPCWGDGRTLLIGDAAHAMGPQIGQGASLALHDALALADGIDAGFDADAVRAALRARRTDEVARALRITRLLTPVFHSNTRLARWVRERAIPLATRFAAVRARMLETMAGEADPGHVGASRPIAPPAQSSSNGGETRRLPLPLAREVARERG